MTTLLRKFTIMIMLAVAALSVSAQTGVGNWVIHPVFAENIINIVDTGDLIYYLADGNLFYYDKKADENHYLSRNNKLNDVNVSQIFYNYDARYLVVVYESGNIDVITSDGTVINAPDISKADIDPKTINYINFKDNKVYLATGFGFAILNANKDFEVIESQNFGENITSITEVSDFIIIGKANGAFMSPKSLAMHSPSTFTKFHVQANARFFNINDSTILLDEGWIYRYTFDSSGVKSKSVAAQASINMLAKTPTGFMGTSKYRPSKIVTFDSEGLNGVITELPSEMSASIVTTAENDGSLWELSSKGVRHLKLENGEVSTIYADYFKYNSSTVLFPYNLCFNEPLNKLYVMDCGANYYWDDNVSLAHINTLENGFWTDMMPDSIPTIGTYPDGKLRGIYSPVFDPDDPETYYIGTRFEGMLKIKGKEVVAKYDWTNSPFLQNWAATVNCLYLDSKKTLWAHKVNSGQATYTLPREKQQGMPSIDDWVLLNVDMNTIAQHKTKMLVTKRDEIKIMIVNGACNQLLVFNDGGNPTSTSIPSIIFNSGDFLDQDEKPFTWDVIYCFTEDRNGRVWLGTSNGVIEFNPSNIFDSNFRINRIKVPRNDGTNYADYLLSGTIVTALAVDGANRKWIGTRNMGLYLVSADGSQILKHFTTENSPLTSNYIISLCCNPTNNEVYIGTPLGLVEYYSDAAPAAESYSEIYAYPNPVRPDYTGDIIITGLMENSLVKIADAGGRVIRSIQSTGGMASWDGCYQSGERVKTGVYYVLASSNEDESSHGVVTKILFIK